jgi:hypothetical protein
MKLTDLNPHWVCYGGRRLGITFDCPHCRTQRLGVPFHHSGQELVEDAAILAVSPSAKIWTETNPVDDTFENLTLSPSIDCSSSGHWHGFITNGEIA